MIIPQDKIRAFQSEILDWYKVHQRDLPWRKSRDPYHVLVSEIMLQQTQVSRVISKYEAWLQRFPTVKALADAPVAEVLRFWSGLGYNRRALNLKKAAEAVVRDFNGIFPSEEENLLQLPGVGKYTARAVLCFAFDAQVAVVDTNVKKVILRKFEVSNDKSLVLHDKKQEIGLSEKEYWEIAEQLVPHGKAYDWNQALMDYASAMLKHEKIPIPKQSKFVGSHRYYRGKILKILLQRGESSREDLHKLIAEDSMNHDTHWFKKLLDELEKEGFLYRKGNSIRLAIK